MAMITFEDLPSTNTPINAANLNNNFSETEPVNSYNTSTSKSYSCDYINTNYKSKKELSTITIFSGSTSAGNASTINTTWAALGKFSFLAIRLRTGNINNESTAFFGYDTLSSGSDLKSGARTINSYSSFNKLGTYTSINLIPSVDIGTNTITFSGYGNDTEIKEIKVIY